MELNEPVSSTTSSQSFNHAWQAGLWPFVLACLSQVRPVEAMLHCVAKDGGSSKVGPGLGTYRSPDDQNGLGSALLSYC